MSSEPRTMIAAVAREPRAVPQLESVTLNPCREDEVVVRLVSTGICQTDVHAIAGKFTPLPAIFGHEGSGIVEEVGAAVTDIAVGDHVVMSYLSCGVCGNCLSGHQSACGHAGALCFGGARPDGSHAVSASDGSVINDRFFGQSSFAEFAVANRVNVVKVPADLPLWTLGPLGCGIMTGAGAVWNVLDLQPDDSLVVFGAGAVGMSAIIAARIAGARTIVAVDRVASRLDMARELGADHAIDASFNDASAELKAIAPDGFDRAFDTTGMGSVITTAFAALSSRGVLALAAHTDPSFRLDLQALIMGSRSVRGVAEGGRSAQFNIGRILENHCKGEFPFERLLTKYDREQIGSAIADSVSGAVIKPVIVW